MAIFESSCLTSIVTATAGTPIAVLRAGARPMRVYELGMSALTAPTTSGRLGIAHSTVISATPTGQVLGQGIDPANAVTAVGGWYTGWTTAPTPGVRKRQFAFAPNIGAAVIFPWPSDRELVIPANANAASELVVVNEQSIAPGTWLLYAVWEE